VTLADSAPSRGSLRLLLAVGGVLVAADLLSLWTASASDTVTLWGPAAILMGSGCALAGAFGQARPTRTRTSQLLVTAGGLMLAAPLLSALGNARLGEATVTAGAALVPLCLLGIVPTHRARLAQNVLLLVLLASGAAAVGVVAGGAAHAVAGPALTGSVALFAAGWVQFELSSGAGRRQVLWLVLGVCSSTLLAALFLVAADTVPGRTTAVSFVATLLATLAIALLRPDRWDVRSAISRVVLGVVMLTLSLSLFAVCAALLHAALHQQPPVGLLGAVAGLIAALHHSVLVQARRTIDELLFGGRAELIPTLTLLGEQLSTATAPAQWLESLRSALAVPGLVLQDGAVVLATAGALGAQVTSLPLRAGKTTAGELLIGLPPDQLRLPAATQTVLQLVATPLAQALQAARLSEQLQRSRGEVVGVLEEERRRMRRDLHDGLGPTLTGVAYSADAAANILSSRPSEAAALLQALRADVAAAIDEIRRIVYGLRPKSLDELGLVAAVRSHSERLLARDGKPFTVEVSAPALPELPAAVEVAAFRVAVEAVTNVARHAATDRADVTFLLDGPDLLDVTVKDSGTGDAAWTEGVGIASMRERVEQIGGSLTIDTHVTGSVVRARLPIHQGHAPKPMSDLPAT
jgi:signal transduction histidine kinase